MRNISPIITTNMRNNFRSKTVIIIWYGTALLILVALAALFGILLIAPEVNKVSPDRAKLELYLGIIMFSASALGVGINLNALGFTSMIKEKSRGNIQSLLATPVRLKDIWIGKSLAIFIPGYVISVISTMIVLLAVNLSVIVPTTGDFLLPLPLFLLSLILNPLLLLGLLLFIILFSLANNPDIAITPSFLVGFGLMMGIPLGMATGAINLSSWSFSLWYLAGVIIVWIIVLLHARLLTKEKIILSSKGS